MNQQYIRDFYGHILGILEISQNGDQLIRSYPDGHILGYYRAKLDHTTDFFGKILTKGNTLVSLLPSKKNY